LESVNVAFHVPLMLSELELLEPQPNNVRPNPSNKAAANCFMNHPSGLRIPKGRVN